MTLGIVERTSAAEALRRGREDLAGQVTTAFLARHPDWIARYGDGARRHGVADALFHVDFLAGAIEAGSGDAFAAYAAWSARVLEARGISTAFLRENLVQIRDAMSPLLAPAQAAFAQEVIDDGCRACEGNERIGGAPAMGPLALARETFLQAILAGRRQAAATVAVLAARDVARVDVYVEVIQEALYSVGRLWEQNRITVAQEHMATAVAQFAVSQVFQEAPPVTPRHGIAVITGVEGERHQIGAHIVADALEADGWDVRFLGVDVPMAGVLRVVEELRPRLLGISATMLFNVGKVAALVAGVRGQARPDAPAILLGGGAFRAAPAVWREMGASGCALDIRAALALANGLAL